MILVLRGFSLKPNTIYITDKIYNKEILYRGVKSNLSSLMCHINQQVATNSFNREIMDRAKLSKTQKQIINRVPWMTEFVRFGS